MKDNYLEVGDELYYTTHYGKVKEYAGKIDRVTKTLAFIGSLKLKRRYYSSTNEPGHSHWNYTSYYLTTPEILEEIKHNKWRLTRANIIIKWAGNNIYQAVNQLTDEELDSMANILKTITEHKD